MDLDEEKLCFAPCELGGSDKKSAAQGSRERIFAPDCRDLLMLEPGHCPALAEFYLFKSVDTYTLKTPKHKSRSSKSYSRQRFQIHVRRKWGSYFANIIVTMWLITSLAFLAWFVPVTDAGAVASRLSYLVTLLLSAISFRFVVRSYLPAISYLTMLDSFTLVSTLFVALAAAEAAFISLVNRSGWWTSSLRAPGATILYSAESMDSFAWWALLAGWFTYCLYWVSRFFMHWRSLDKNSFHMDNDYEKKHRPGDAAPRPPLTCPECHNAIALVSAFDILCNNASPWHMHVPLKGHSVRGFWRSLWEICFQAAPLSPLLPPPTVNFFDRVFVHRHNTALKAESEEQLVTYVQCGGSHLAAIEFDADPTIKGSFEGAILKLEAETATPLARGSILSGARVKPGTSIVSKVGDRMYTVRPAQTAASVSFVATPPGLIDWAASKNTLRLRNGGRFGWRFTPDTTLEESKVGLPEEAAVGTPAVE